MTQPNRPPKLWRLTSKHPRHVLAIAIYTLFAACVLIAIGAADTPAAVVVALVPAPVLLLVAFAETHRALHETKERS